MLLVYLFSFFLFPKNCAKAIPTVEVRNKPDTVVFPIDAKYAPPAKEPTPI